jgi:hypothetical protein
MRNVEIENCEDDDLQYLVRNCPSLRRLGITTRTSAGQQVVRAVGLLALVNLHQSLEEFSYLRRSDGLSIQEFYTHTAAVLIDVLRECPCLHKVSLTGDALHSVDLAELRAFGHLFYELEVCQAGRPVAYGQGISQFLTSCGNLRKLCYKGLVSEQDFLVFTAQSWPLLEELEFSFNQEGRQQIAGTRIFPLISRSCRHLHLLQLYRCELSASSLCSIADMETLKELFLEECEGLAETGIAVLATMKLVTLSIGAFRNYFFSDGTLQSLIGSNISQSLVTFHLAGYRSTILIDDVQVATALASCHNLTKLFVDLGRNDCVFGRSGMDGLQAMAAGCPLLAVVTLPLTAPAIRYLASHFTNLQLCSMLHRVVPGASPAPEGFPSVEELQTLSVPSNHVGVLVKPFV